MTNFSWTDLVSYHDPASGQTIETTLEGAAKSYGDLPAVQSMRATATLHDPIDLGDGAGLRTELESSDLAKLGDQWEAHQKAMRR
jgi:hypothetical protein